MSKKFVFGFILLILLIVGVFVGLPYAINAIRSGSFSLPFSFPKIAINPVSNYFYNKPPAEAPTQTPVIKPGESLYKGRVGIGNVYFFGADKISLRASYSGGNGAINITGWKIKSAQRGETVIGRGINLPQFDSSPSDIWLNPPAGGGDSADIIAGPSPLAVNFRANNCFGWLSNLYNLDYSLSYCPGGFKIGDLNGLDSACQDLILRANFCQAPGDNILNEQSGQCRDWVAKSMNYNACVINHRGDSDFYKEWKIYTGNGNQFFDPLHDKIELRDQAGLLVDTYEY